MKLDDMFFYSLNALRQRSIRSWLTILGIVVGITAIVVLIGLVQGLRNYFTDQLATFGSNSIIILPVNLQSGANPSASSYLPSNGKLFMKDYDRIKGIPGIETITPIINGRATVQYKDTPITTSVLGVDPVAYLNSVTSMKIYKGRFLQSADQKSVVIGFTVSNDTFKDEVPLSATLNISGESYRVVGILNKSGSSFSNLDSSIIIPFDQAKVMFQDVLADREISMIRITVKDGESVKDVASRIEDTMLAAHRVTEDDKDFSVITSDFINQQLDSVLGILGLFLGGVASISLVVGGIGIANTMFMSVTERRREIGILKSLGAREIEIERLFLVESSMIGMAGGFLGLVIAYGLGFIITLVSGVDVAISPLVVLGAISFSAIVGIISGLFPARQAARMDPVEALTV